MENENKTQLQALLNLNCRLLALEKLTAAYKKNKKALKLCLKLIKIECKELKTCNSVSAYDLSLLQHKYIILLEIVKRLTKVSNSGAASAAADDLNKLIEQTQAEVSDLNERLNPLSENVRKLAASIDGTAKIISRKIESGTQMLSDAISDTVDEIKKKFSGNENSENKD